MCLLLLSSQKFPRLPFVALPFGWSSLTSKELSFSHANWHSCSKDNKYKGYNTLFLTTIWDIKHKHYEWILRSKCIQICIYHLGHVFITSIIILFPLIFMIKHCTNYSYFVQKGKMWLSLFLACFMLVNINSTIFIFNQHFLRVHITLL